MKKWEKPTLIVLVRSRPEESVLETCKSSLQTGPVVAPGGCVQTVDGVCFGFAPCEIHRDS
jgi:hypothetical protein